MRQRRFRTQEAIAPEVLDDLVEAKVSAAGERSGGRRGARDARGPDKELGQRMRRWLGSTVPTGLGARVFGLVWVMLVGAYAVGLYISSQDLRDTYYQQYIRQTEELARTLDAFLAEDLLNDAALQRRLDTLIPAVPRLVQMQIYVPKPAGLVVVASTNRNTVGMQGDSSDAVPLVTNVVHITERAANLLEMNAPLHLQGRAAAVLGVYVDLSEPTEAISAHLLKFAGLGAAAILILGLVLSRYLRYEVVRPITELAAAAAALGGGQFDVRGRVSGGSEEVRRLVDAFNEMAKSVAMTVAMRHDMYLDAIQLLAAAIDARDHYTAGHSSRVSALATRLAKQMGLTEKEIEQIRDAGLLHDIGKIGVPDSLLRRDGLLTIDEREILNAHPAIAASIIVRAGELANLAPLVRHHHERYDGSGYPDGLKGAAIPQGARILCVADSFDAMTSDRPYRHALSHEAAIAELVSLTGAQFDPMVIEAFLAVKGASVEVHGRFASA